MSLKIDPLIINGVPTCHDGCESRCFKADSQIGRSGCYSWDTGKHGSCPENPTLCEPWEQAGFAVEIDDPAAENERCKLALQNLSACGYGQTLTQAVDGISELVKAFRESDTKLRDEKEQLQNALREMVRRTYSETELRRMAREALDSCENS